MDEERFKGIVRETNGPQETSELAFWLGQQAQAGQIYCLDGELGAGKTVFAQGFAAGLGVDEPVNSPTFTIIQQYEKGRLPLYHFDVYRLGSVEEMDEIGYEDYFYGDAGVCSALSRRLSHFELMNHMTFRLLLTILWPPPTSWAVLPSVLHIHFLTSTHLQPWAAMSSSHLQKHIRREDTGKTLE